MKENKRMHTGSQQKQARDLALFILIQVMEEGGFSHVLLRDALAENSQLSEKDRAFVTRLVEGTLEYGIQLDAVINAYSKTKTEKMKPFIRNLLRMSLYQLLYLDKVPASAAINEAVKLAKQHKFAGLSGFVNGVLRSMERNLEEIRETLADENKTPLYIRYSMPEWLYRYLEQHYGAAEAGRICTYFLSDDNASYVRYQDGRMEKLSGNIAASDAFLAGELTVQDYASQQVGLIAAPEAGAYVVDVCAAPGGKSCHIAQLLAGSGCVDARDLTEAKVKLIRENADRLHLSNIRMKVWDARVLDTTLLTTMSVRDGDGERRTVTRGKADLVIADLPCSGLGIIGKKPDIKLGASMEQVLSLQALQRDILETVCQYVKPGGRLLYSTCTITEEENEQNARWIQEQLPFTLLQEKRFLPGQPSDGFYIAEFQRQK